MTQKVDARLRLEILNLFHYVQRLREEIAAVARRQEGQTTFESMSDQLDAIVSSTGTATHTILEGVEAIVDAARELREHPDAEAVDKLCDRIDENAVQAMEACSFQDIAGQRVSKIVRSVRFIEERVEAMAELWGREEIETLSQQLPVEEEEEEKISEGERLEGPQLPGAAISQDDIDKLFD